MSEGARIGGRGWAAAGILAALLAAAFVSPPAADEAIPPLRPPQAELPPGFWEQHGRGVALSGGLVLALAAAGFWRLARPRPRPAAAPAVEARERLRSLEGEPETPVSLTRISRCLRHYLVRSFGLPIAEPTSAELTALLRRSGGAAAELSGPVAAFLAECDRRKFAPGAGAGGAAARQALELIETAETRLAAPLPPRGAAAS